MSQSLYFDIAIRGLIFLKNYLKIKTNKEEKMKKRGILYKTICQERTHAFNDCGVGEGDDVPCAYVMGEDGGVALVASSENGKTNSWPDGEEVVYDSFISTDGQHRQLMARNVWLARELKHVHALVAWVKEWVDLDKVSYELDPSSLIKTFRSLNFGLQPESVSGPLDQQEVVVNNLELNQKSCLGRLALAAAVAEKHFPGIKVFGAEVWEDGLRNRLLAMLKVDPSLADDPSFWRELLLYEEPHAVLYFQGRQYDPLETVLHEPIRHPPGADPSGLEFGRELLACFPPLAGRRGNGQEKISGRGRDGLPGHHVGRRRAPAFPDQSSGRQAPGYCFGRMDGQAQSDRPDLVRFAPYHRR